MLKVKHVVTNLVRLVLLVRVFLATGHKVYGLAGSSGILSCVCARTFTWDIALHRINWIHRAWFDEYNFKITSTDKHTPFYFLLQPLLSKDSQELYYQYNIYSYDLKLAYKFSGYSTLIKYTLTFPPVGWKIGIHFLDNPEFNILSIVIIFHRYNSRHKITYKFHTNKFAVEIKGE